MLLGKLEALLDYVIREDVFSNLTSSEPAYTLLHVVNSTIPSVIAHVSSTQLQIYTRLVNSFGLKDLSLTQA